LAVVEFVEQGATLDDSDRLWSYLLYGSDNGRRLLAYLLYGSHNGRSC